MTVFKTFFKVARAYIRPAIIYTCIFLGIILLINKSYKNEDSSYENARLDLAIFDNDHSDLSEHLSSYLEEKHNLVTLSYDKDAFRDAIYQRTCEYVLIIPKGYEKGDATLESYKLPGSIYSSLLESNIDQYLSLYKSYLSMGLKPDSAHQRALDTIDKTVDVKLQSAKQTNTNKPEHRFFSYFTYAIVSVIISVLTPILIRFHNGDLKMRSLCSGISTFRRSLSLTLGSAIFTMIILSVYLIIGGLLFPDWLNKATFMARLCNTFTYSMVCLAATFLISTLTSNLTVVDMVSNVVGLTSSFLCGVFVPAEYLSKSVLQMGQFLPCYWYMNVERAISQNSYHMSFHLTNGILVQWLFFIALMAMGLLAAKKERF
ncbi:MAG: ABC transporter permease [Lachnospiraceae bacterium]|nr:ABC transporter permease [Lachnospiraceae bacterium]